MRSRFGRTALLFVASMLVGSSAFAQAVRTWVSGVGDDANPCSRSAPCKTFAGALSRTLPGGEISVLDPGGYGTVIINKPITISGVGEQSSILAGGGVTGVTINIATPVNPPLPNVVTLRNIQINGAGASSPGLNGIRVFGDTMVILDDVNIFGFSGNGILTEGTSQVLISDSVLSNISGIAVHSTATSGITVENSQLVGNGIAVQPDLGSEIRLSNNGVYNNLTGFACGTGGTLSSANNNRKARNTGGTAPACIPTTTITIQ